ncbi:hypothetical protein DNTS_010302 [Danionella cerebrum]|uniref:Transmembrane protein 240 n=1 Tax=Danionella cerebrum TaxID=2873325 RepID=A0A553MRD2_9TELE|nr:hypothetical protein DNTS_010302 [Danionella translucida]
MAFAVCTSDMNALLDRFHNFILPRMRGPERVCHCTCGRQRVEHVIPFEGSLWSGSGCVPPGSISKQQLDFILGLAMGICCTVVLLWLEGLLHSQRGADGELRCMWRWVSRVCDLRELRRRLQPRRNDEAQNSVKHKHYHNGHANPRRL